MHMVDEICRAGAKHLTLPCRAQRRLENNVFKNSHPYTSLV